MRRCSVKLYFSLIIVLFSFGMLDRSDRIEDAGYMKWDLTLTLLLAWILCFLCVIKGIKSSGKVR